LDLDPYTDILNGQSSKWLNIMPNEKKVAPTLVKFYAVIVKFVIAKFVTAKFVIAKVVIAKFISAKFVIADLRIVDKKKQAGGRE